MLARLRISLPDRPGTLGRVTTAIGAAGGDIAGLEVLESQAGRALDDLFVTVRDERQLLAVRDSVQAEVGVEVVGLQAPVPPVTGHTDLELIHQVLAQPDRAVRTLVDGAPAALGADWAAVLAFDSTGAQTHVVARSLNAVQGSIALTAPLRIGAVTLNDPSTGDPFSGAALVPLANGPLGLLLVRTTGVGFHSSELFRLAQIGSLLTLAASDVQVEVPAEV